MANKLCAQQTAKIWRKAPKGIFDMLKPAQMCRLWLWLLNMAVVVDMLFTVAVVAFAAGAVPEFQIGIGGVRFAADRAFVPVGLFTGFAAVVVGGHGRLRG